jgi:riboflavin biosynthesis pyrimidine reductase
VTLYRVFPDPRLAIDLDTDEGLDLLRELYTIDHSPSVRVNMIVRPDGSIVGSDGTSGSLTSPDDRSLLRLLRSMADAVIIGAETIRQERVPVPRGIPLVVVSNSGNIPASHVVCGPESGELVVVTPSADTASTTLSALPHRIIEPGQPSPTATQIIDLCVAEGWNNIVVEGGKQLVTLFANAGVVDDLCLTLTGAPQSEDTPPVSWWPEGTTWMTSHLLMDDNRMLYHRYVSEGGLVGETSHSRRVDQ